jgi:hypothetical protein
VAADADAAERQLNGSVLEDAKGDPEDVEGDTETVGIKGHSPLTLRLAVSLGRWWNPRWPV